MLLSRPQGENHQRCFDPGSLTEFPSAYLTPGPAPLTLAQPAIKGNHEQPRPLTCSLALSLSHKLLGCGTRGSRLPSGRRLLGRWSPQCSDWERISGAPAEWGQLPPESTAMLEGPGEKIAENHDRRYAESALG